MKMKNTSDQFKQTSSYVSRDKFIDCIDVLPCETFHTFCNTLFFFLFPNQGFIFY